MSDALPTREEIGSNFVDALRVAQEKFAAHPLWTRLDGTPWQNDAPVIAAKLMCEIADALFARLRLVREQLLNAPPVKMSYNGRLLPINSTGMRELVDEATTLRASEARLRDCCLLYNEAVTVLLECDHGDEQTCSCRAEAREQLAKIAALAEPTG